MKTETRVYIINWSNVLATTEIITNEEFMTEAESIGSVYTLERFKEEVNKDQMDLKDCSIRILDVEVPSDDSEVNITVNKLELASDLAHNAMCDELGVSIDDWEDNEEVVSITNGNRGYTENAQNIFNRWYDYFIHHIEATKAQ